MLSAFWGLTVQKPDVCTPPKSSSMAEEVSERVWKSLPEIDTEAKGCRGITARPHRGALSHVTGGSTDTGSRESNATHPCQAPSSNPRQDQIKMNKNLGSIIRG